MSNSGSQRIYLSPPHMGGNELINIKEAFSSNYIAPEGPQIAQFEKEFAQKVGAKYAVAVSSGTAALHLALRAIGLGQGDEVFCSTFTFVASANAILYQGASPVFIDSDTKSWNLDPILLEKVFLDRAKQNSLPKALVLVHLYGQPADIDPIVSICNKYSVPLIEDAAEALGANYKGRAPGSFGIAGIFSFNGNKIITTSGGGMLVTDESALVDKVRFWSTQSREPTLHYEHKELGYNYRMSNVLAAIGRGQLDVLDDRVERKREIFQIYKEELKHLTGLSFMPEPDYAYSTRWLSCATIDPEEAKTDRLTVINALKDDEIEARPSWKPMHLQPLFSDCCSYGGAVSEKLFHQGICFPSGTSMSHDDLQRIIRIIKKCWE